MKTFTKTLVAAGVGLFGIGTAANAATPCGSFSSTQSIAVGGCYQPVNDSRCDSYTGCFGPISRPGSSYDDYAYRPLPSRSVYDVHQSYHTPPYSTSRWNDRRWDDVASNHRRFEAVGRRTNSSSIYDRDYGRFDNRRFEDRYDGSPSFEPWRPMNVSNTSHPW